MDNDGGDADLLSLEGFFPDIISGMVHQGSQTNTKDKITKSNRARYQGSEEAEENNAWLPIERSVVGSVLSCCCVRCFCVLSTLRLHTALHLTITPKQINIRPDEAFFNTEYHFRINFVH
jgi:hypothetical protein